MAENFKFNRYYELTVSFNDGRDNITIKPPLNIEFDAIKYDTGATSSAFVKIYNLNKDNQIQLQRNDNEIGKIITVELRVGYDNNNRKSIQTLFKQVVLRGYTYRDGADYITALELNATTNILDNAFVSVTVANQNQQVSFCTTELKKQDILKGYINKRPDTTRNVVTFGNAYDILFQQKAYNEKMYIDDGQVYILKDNQVIGNFVPVVSPETGLIDTPILQNNLINFTMILSPEIRVSRRFNVQSSVNENVNGVYKAIQIQYSGSYYGDNWKQTVTGSLHDTFEVI